MAGRLGSGALLRWSLQDHSIGSVVPAQVKAWYVLVSGNRLQNQALARFFGYSGENKAELKVEKGSEAA
jgi:hypothetical protein